MALSIKGKIEKILDAESGVSRAGNQWNKQEFVIETTEQFPKKVCFTLFGDKTSMVENIAVGEEVEVSFNLESREFNGKWFHNINAWKIDRTSEAPVADLPPEYSVDDIPPELADDVTNDLPF